MRQWTLTNLWMRARWIKNTLKTQLIATYVSVNYTMIKYLTIAILQVDTEVQHITNVTYISDCIQTDPVFFHNLSGHDSHLFIKRLHVKPGKIDCIPNNEEAFLSFSKEITVVDKDGEESKVEIRFLDSYKFMDAPLAELADNLPPEACTNLARSYQGEKFALMKRKGEFPYDWFNDREKLNATELPPKEEFYNILNDSNITDEGYQHAKNVWKVFDMKTFRKYRDKYLETDVLLLLVVLLRITEKLA